jgi:uridine kinase
MSSLDNEFKIAQPRQSVEVNLSSGQVITGPRGAAVGKFFKAQVDPDLPPIVGAIVNGELRELTFPIRMESIVHPVTMGEADGMRIYRRSLTFLLDSAFHDLFPEAVLNIDHSVSSGGYYCRVSGRPPLSKEELDKLENQMREMVKADLPFAKRTAPLSEAIKYFKERNHQDKVRLLTHRRKDYLTLYNLDDHLDYHHGYMVPSTGYLQWFSLEPTEDSFTLRFPRRHKPTEILPLPEYPKLLATFRQYGNWLDRMDIGSVGALNDSIQDGRVREIILVSEALQEQQVSAIAAQIAHRIHHDPDSRIILIAGPSSSGKTTFSKRLAVQLLAYGYSPFPLGMDNYFLDRDKTPFNSRGELDFESIRALDRIHLSRDLNKLIAGETVCLPHFNFKKGVKEEGEMIRLARNEIIILEGIHGLNPYLLPEIPAEKTYRIYVSALTQLNLDHHNRISTTDTRLVRRIVRDAPERGYTATDTIMRWDSVRRGEKLNIFPYQENADVMFNSALVYEMAALKSSAEPLLRQVEHGTPEHVEAKRMLALLEWFLPLDIHLIPDNSILREFIGGSILKEFKLWKNTNGIFSIDEESR